MLDEFLKNIEDKRLAGKNDRILLAVSGGIDSMVMADLFLRSGYKVGIIHCNFCLRGNESDKDEDLVERLASANNVPFWSKKFNTSYHAKKNGISIQMAARELRYKWFEEIRRKNGYDYVAIAHNLNDSIETFLINLTRGTGIAGLTGIRPSYQRIIRPLLFAKRDTIERYCSEHKITYREDRSNSETKYVRNKIRHLVIPVLREINPSAEHSINETAERLGQIYEALSDYIGNIRDKAAEEEKDKTAFNSDKLKPFVHNDGLLFELFRPYGITTATLNDLKKIISGKTGKQVFTRTHRFVKDRDRILISEITQEDEMFFEISTYQELRSIPCIKTVTRKKINPELKIPSDPLTACLDFGSISFPIVIRKWRPGDFFYPLGMNRRKKLSDYFTDRKLSRLDKDRILVMECEGKIIWIIGERIDNRFRITPETEQALIIKVTNLTFYSRIP
jgi:tRNA(Ile)-lysidine synthase